MPTTEYQHIVNDWPEKSREACKRIVEKYGEPDEACTTRLIWRNSGPWKRQELFRDPVQHDRPMEHEDMLEGFPDYRDWKACSRSDSSPDPSRKSPSACLSG